MKYDPLATIYVEIDMENSDDGIPIVNRFAELENYAGQLDQYLPNMDYFGRPVPYPYRFLLEHRIGELDTHALVLEFHAEDWRDVAWMLRENLGLLLFTDETGKIPVYQHGKSESDYTNPIRAYIDRSSPFYGPNGRHEYDALFANFTNSYSLDYEIDLTIFYSVKSNPSVLRKIYHLAVFGIEYSQSVAESLEESLEEALFDDFE